MAEAPSSRADATAGSPPLRRIHLGWIALAYLALFVYGSLVPLQYSPMPLGEAVGRLARTADWGLMVASRSDWVVNVFLTVPLAFLLTGALCRGGRRRTAVAAAALVIPCCMLLSVGIELAQVFFRHRVASAGDVAAQWLGTLAGVSLWLVGGEKLTAWLWRMRSPREGSGAASLLVPGYLVLLVMIHTIPFDLTPSPAEMVRKWRAGRVVLVPFASFQNGSIEAEEGTLTGAAYFAGLGMLWALVSRRGRSAWRRLLWPLGLGLGVAGMVELLQLLVHSRRFDTTGIVCGTAGFVAGWAVGAWLRPGTAPCEAGGRGLPEGRRRRGAARLVRVGLWGLAVAGWLAVLAASHWRPFDFSLDRGRVAQRLEGLRRLPLADYHGQPAFQSLYQLLKKTLLFLPLGLILTLGIPPGSERLGVPLVLLGVAAAAVIVEAGQLLLPSRYPGMTDVLIGCFGGGLGCFAGRCVQSAEAAGGRIEAGAGAGWAGGG